MLIRWVEDLQSLAGRLSYPVFWAGPADGYAYELTRGRNGNVYIRYLPRGTEPGDPRATFLTVATYPLANGFARTRAAARSPEARGIRIKRGGLVVVDNRRPSSVYLAYPRGKYQVEIFAPSPRRARNLAVSGRIRPIG